MNSFHYSCIPNSPCFLGHLIWKFSNYLDFSLWGKTVRCLIKLHLIWIKWFHEIFFLHLFLRIFSLFFIFSFVFCHFFWRFWVRIRRFLPSTSFVSRWVLSWLFDILIIFFIVFVFAFLNFPAIIFTDGSSDNYGFGFVFVFKLILFVKSFFYVISEKKLKIGGKLILFKNFFVKLNFFKGKFLQMTKKMIQILWKKI